MFVSVNTIGTNDGFIQLFHRQIPILVQDGYTIDLWLKVNDAVAGEDVAVVRNVPVPVVP